MKKQIKYAGIVFCLAILGWMGYDLWRLPFWGYRPMFFFMALIGLGILLFEPKLKKHPQGLKFTILAITSGFLFYLGFPTMPLTPLIFLAFVPLLIVEDKLYHWRPSTSLWEVFKYSYITFIIWNVMSTFWVANTSFVPSFFAFGLNALFMTVPILGYHLVRKKLSNRYRFIALICFWISFEYGHMAWEVSWPWLTLGNTFAQYPSWVQWYEFTGHLGGSFWVLLGNILAFQFYNQLQKKEALTVRPLLYFFGTIMIPVMISLIMYVKYEEKGEPVNVAVVQGNYEPHYSKFSVSKAEILQNFIQQSKSILNDSIQYLIYPETSFWDYDVDQLNQYQAILDLRTLINQYPNLSLVTGLVSTKQLFDDDKNASWARTSVNKFGDTITWELHNSAIQLDAGTNKTQVHIKSKLVPGAEILPYNRLLFFLEPIVKMVGGTTAGHARRKERTVFEKDNGLKTAPVICYESVYGEYVGDYIRKGAQAIFIVTNDGWWDKTPGHIQHLKFGALRAIEYRKPIARAANTGISCFINQRGNIIKPTSYETQDAIKHTLYFNSERTFYSIWRDLIARLSLLGTIILILSMIVRKYRVKKPK